MSFCTNCGAGNEAANNFCQSCGAALNITTAISDIEARVASATRTCGYCDEIVSANALKCPKCTKWRKDIEEDRIKSYVWGAAAPAFPFIFFLVGIREGWWEDYGRFSLSIFMASQSGLAILAAEIVVGFFSFYYYARVSRKIGSWVWF